MAMTDTTVNVALIWAIPRPAEIRTATDLVNPEISPIATSLEISTSEAAHRFDLQVKEIPKSPSLPWATGSMAPWLINALSVIDAARNLPGANADVMKTAELAAAFLCDAPSRRRPQITINEEGEVSFATATEDFYLNLTIDSPNRITWYAVDRGQEHFHEGVTFDRRKLPISLHSILFG